MIGRDQGETGMDGLREEALDCTIAAGVSGALGVGLIELARRSANSGHKVSAGVIAASAVLPVLIAYHSVNEAVFYSQMAGLPDQMSEASKNGGAVGTHF